MEIKIPTPQYAPKTGDAVSPDSLQNTMLQLLPGNSVKDFPPVNSGIVIQLRLSPGRDNSPMPVTRVTGCRSIANPKSRRDDSKVPHHSLSSLPGLCDHTSPYPSALADGREPPSLPGLSRKFEL